MRLIFVALLAVTALFYIACTPAAAPVAIGNTPISVNGIKTTDVPGAPSRPLSEMSWTGFEGDVSKLKDHRGKAVVLDFWATNCPPCIEEIPHLIELKARYGDDLELIGLHVGDDEDREKVPEFVQKLKITYPLAFPDDALTNYIFETQSAIPQTAVFDRNGVMVRKIVGFSPSIKAQLDEAVKRVLSKHRLQTEQQRMKTRELVSAGGVAFRRNGGLTEIVLIQTSSEGRWQLPKGIVDPGESNEEAAVREVSEEAGINCEIVGELNTIDYWYVERHGKVPERIHKTVYFFLMRYIDGDVADHDDEVTEARWVAADGAVGMLAFETERSVVEKGVASIS